MNYKLTINAVIEFDYYPFAKTTSEEVPLIVNHDELEYYCESHDVELEITPKMLLEAIKYVYSYDKSERDKSQKEYELEVGLQNCPFLFSKLCAEVFNEENLDSYSSYYDYLTGTDEFKKKEQEIIKNEVRTLGELYE